MKISKRPKEERLQEKMTMKRKRRALRSSQ